MYGNELQKNISEKVLTFSILNLLELVMYYLCNNPASIATNKNNVVNMYVCMYV